MNDLMAALDRLADDPAAPRCRVDLNEAVRGGRRRRHRRRLAVAGVTTSLAVGAAGVVSMLPSDDTDPGGVAVPGAAASGFPANVPTLTPQPGVPRTLVPLDLTSCPRQSDDELFRIQTSGDGGTVPVLHDPMAARASDETIARGVVHALACAFPQVADDLPDPATWRFDERAPGEVPLAGGESIRLGWVLNRATALTPSPQRSSGDGAALMTMRMEQDVRTDVPGRAGSGAFSFDDGRWDWRSFSAGDLTWRPTVGVPLGWKTTDQQRRWGAYLVARALVDTGVLPGTRP